MKQCPPNPVYREYHSRIIEIWDEKSEHDCVVQAKVVVVNDIRPN